MKCRVLVWSTLLTLTAAAAAAQNVAGTWTASTRSPLGQTELVFNFNVDGKNLTGTTGGRGVEVPISDGVIEAASLSFTATLQNSGGIKMRFTGTVEGDELLLTRTFADGPPVRAPAEQKLTARRAQ